MDASYGTNGSAKFTGLVPVAVAMQPDGKLLVAGSRRTGSLPAINYGGAPAREVVVRRLTANGATDTSFGTNGEVSFTIKGSDAPEDIKLQKNGRIVVAVLAGEPCVHSGYGPLVPCVNATGTAALRSSNLVALTAAGQLDRTFGRNGIAEKATDQSSSQLSLAVASDDTLLLLESNVTTSLLAQYFSNRLDRVTADGIVENLATQPSAEKTCNDRSGTALLIQNSGRIVTGGISRSTGLCITEHDPKTVWQTKAAWTQFNGSYGLSSLKSTSDDGFVAVGKNCNSSTCQLGIARFQANGDRQTSYGVEGFAYLAIPQYAAIASTLVLSDDSVVVLANRTEYDATGANPQYGAVWARMGPQGDAVKDFGTQGLMTPPLSTLRPIRFVPDSQGRWLVVSLEGQADDSSATFVVKRVAGHSKP
jgi:uncharacterized delta-60 repeat protein